MIQNEIGTRQKSNKRNYINLCFKTHKRLATLQLGHILISQKVVSLVFLYSFEQIGHGQLLRELLIFQRNLSMRLFFWFFIQARCSRQRSC